MLATMYFAWSKGSIAQVIREIYFDGDYVSLHEGSSPETGESQIVVMIERNPGAMVQWEHDLPIAEAEVARLTAEIENVSKLDPKEFDVKTMVKDIEKALAAAEKRFEKLSQLVQSGSSESFVFDAELENMVVLTE